MLPRIKTTQKHNPRFAKRCTVCCYYSRGKCYLDRMVAQTQDGAKSRFMFWPVCQFPLYPLTTYKHKHIFSHQIKANFSWKQTWILLMYADCIKYCSVRLKMNVKITVLKPQFNILTIPHDTIFV